MLCCSWDQGLVKHSWEFFSTHNGLYSKLQPSHCLFKTLIHLPGNVWIPEGVGREGTVHMLWSRGHEPASSEGWVREERKEAFPFSLDNLLVVAKDDTKIWKERKLFYLLLIIKPSPIFSTAFLLGIKRFNWVKTVRKVPQGRQNVLCIAKDSAIKCLFYPNVFGLIIKSIWKNLWMLILLRVL